ncbi:ABC transporter ATP-binding protein [Ammoniphilus sp. CFH 90114]|uniref:ABC transporter ATP-binding protein n=1 Tax=Ammoniphilus sp. CFH 90114 TaxID=2493665 RepID=UPI00100DBF8E|nr:ABC transporter ATP-binding protein [Ammoniphilus sp. CFH 90114]RXT08954.1 ABC transporter ATP-binding protein [Ammoniphilus sp. CFH 90114]
MFDVELKNIQKRFNNQAVVKDFNLQIEQGEFISFLGPSGCGKTTTLNMVAGFLEPDEGELLIKGKKMNGVPPYKRELGMVFQTYSLFPHMTIEENIGYGLKFRKVPKSEMKDRIQKVLELIKLPHVADRFPKQLSGGQRQRIAIARALVIEPSLLLLDEPLSNLDAKLRHELRNELKRLHQEIGVTTIFVTHDQEEALSLSDRIVVMSHGNIEQIGKPWDIYHHPKTEFVHTFIGSTNRIDGTLVSKSGTELTIKTAQGLIRSTTHSVDTNIGGPISAYVRPEKIRLVHDHGGELTTNQFRGTVTMMNFLGAFMDCDVTNGDMKLTVKLQLNNDNMSIQTGKSVICEWNSEDLFLIPRGEA